VHAREGITITDANGTIIEVNAAFTSITGYSRDEAVGQNPRILRSERQSAEYYAAMWRSLNEKGHWSGEIWNRRKNGEFFVAWLAITTVAGEAGEGRHVATFIDITKRKEAEEIVLYRANFDVLTDLPNRGLFDDRLVGVLAMARRHRRNVALMYIDLDWFKNVNDSLGHAAGDGLLAEAAKRMEKCVRDADTVARFGGDEFALILSDLNDPGEAEEVARRVNKALAEPFELPEGTANVSGSIGIAIFPGDGADELLLKKSADKALYVAKAAGRNTYRLASTC